MPRLPLRRRPELAARGLVFACMLFATLEPCRGDDQSPPAARSVDSNLPRRVDLRVHFKRWRLDPRKQGHRNTCSVFVTTEALEFALAKRQGHGTRLSVEYLNWACNQIIGNRTKDRGQFFHHLLKGFAKYGVCAEDQMPYRPSFEPELQPTPEVVEAAQRIGSLNFRIHWIKRWQAEPGLNDEHLQSIKQQIAAGTPVAAGASHSRLLVGYADAPQNPDGGGGHFVALDSATGAYETVSYAFVKANVADVFWIEL
ncbi:MAG: hypothetical protein KDA61_05805 [Planctomycetales bacterium]|nr:hypothetical protein [Planctomycetales bacterium]